LFPKLVLSKSKLPMFAKYIFLVDQLQLLYSNKLSYLLFVATVRPYKISQINS
jgi:hypothetical protein